VVIVVAEHILDADNDAIEFAPGAGIVLFLVKGFGPLKRFFLKYFNEGIQVMLACDLGKVG
jgi:hypothetical protein